MDRLKRGGTSDGSVDDLGEDCGASWSVQTFRQKKKCNWVRPSHMLLGIVKAQEGVRGVMEVTGGRDGWMYGVNVSFSNLQDNIYILLASPLICSPLVGLIYFRNAGWRLLETNVKVICLFVWFCLFLSNQLLPLNSHSD